MREPRNRRKQTVAIPAKRSSRCYANILARRQKCKPAAGETGLPKTSRVRKHAVVHLTARAVCFPPGLLLP